MATKKNKVKFNICNVHYALITVSEEGEVTFGTPVAMPGAVSLSLEPNGEPSNFYADGYAYYTISNNMGYEGDLELAMVPESFRTDVLKESLDTNQVLVENANVDMLQEMSDMMTAQRALQSAAQVLKLYDGVLTKATTELGRL